MKLVRSKDSFYLMETYGKKTLSKLCILDARRIKINLGVLLAHARMLSKTTAKYPFTRVEVKTFIHAGVVGESIGNTRIVKTNNSWFCR